MVLDIVRYYIVVLFIDNMNRMQFQSDEFSNALYIIII